MEQVIFVNEMSIILERYDIHSYDDTFVFMGQQFEEPTLFEGISDFWFCLP